MDKFLFNNKSLKDRRRELRANQTEAEIKLWEYLRGKRLDSYKFYRQFSIGPYILDFYCPKLRLGIELDGSEHNESGSKLYDKDREGILRASNIKVVRFWNSEVEKNIGGVLIKIQEMLQRNAGN